MHPEATLQAKIGQLRKLKRGTIHTHRFMFMIMREKIEYPN